MKTSTPAATATLETNVSQPGLNPGFEVSPKIPVGEISPPHSWRQWVAFDHSRVLLKQFVFARGKKPMDQLHRLSLDEGEPRASASGFARFGARWIYLLVALRQVWLYFRKYGAFVRKKYGVPRLRQLADLWHCAWHHNQSPRHYYWRKLYLSPDRNDWLEYLEHREVNNLLNHLNRHLPISRVIDKVKFHQHCQEQGLPTATMLAHWNKQGQLIGKAPPALAADVFLKPANEYGSVGIVAIPYSAATGTYRLKTLDLSWPDLLDAISNLARTDNRNMILQRRLKNAPRNGVFGYADICNVRIITGRAPDGEPQPVGGFIRLPSSLTTTGYDRNIMISSVDIKTGRMQPGRFRETMLGDYPLHPDTEEPIENRILPGWDEMIALAIRGHRTYPWMPFIGWDIVDTTDGLLLLEANAYWGGDCVQFPGATPLGQTKFPEIYLKNFEHFYGPNTPAHRAPLE